MHKIRKILKHQIQRIIIIIEVCTVNIYIYSKIIEKYIINIYIYKKKDLILLIIIHKKKI